MYIYDIYIRTTPIFFFFFFNDTATTEIYTLSLHDALPISRVRSKSTRPSKRNPAAATRLAGVPQFRRVSRQPRRSEEHTSELQSRLHLVCRLLLEKKKNNQTDLTSNYNRATPHNTYPRQNH